jgi:hypothetical protein
MRQHASRQTPVNDAYPTCKRTVAELRIYGGALDPHAIAAHLGVQPSGTQMKGEVRAGFRGREVTARIGGWFLSSEEWVSSKDLRRHLDWLLDRLMPAKPALLALQQEEGIAMGVNCIWWSAFGEGGPTLWPEQMRLLAELNLECSFDVSFLEVKEDEEA